jgi:hypothetical protein
MKKTAGKRIKNKSLNTLPAAREKLRVVEEC